MQDQALRDQSRSTTTRDGGWIAGASYLALAAMGLLLGFPALIGDLLVRQIAGSMQDAPWAPFGDDADGKTWLSVLIVLVIGVPLVAAAVMISRATRKNQQLPRGDGQRLPRPGLPLGGLVEFCGSFGCWPCLLPLET
ncbi:hypothetical protein [Kribbella solani]|uniref:Uncharacterized protein n=1 Tax=Kribbella solani TaxID=236067 RepID=A0A841DQN2_9ACTN|nr:hypothetical protein [Kribbella solani]MBB5981444.1 hypothetical protein [Kribbella solani]